MTDDKKLVDLGGLILPSFEEMSKPKAETPSVKEWIPYFERSTTTSKLRVDMKLINRLDGVSHSMKDQVKRAELCRLMIELLFWLRLDWDKGFIEIDDSSLTTMLEIGMAQKLQSIKAL
jgi:hypothetical protein